MSVDILLVISHVFFHTSSVLLQVRALRQHRRPSSVPGAVPPLGFPRGFSRWEKSHQHMGLEAPNLGIFISWMYVAKSYWD